MAGAGIVYAILLATACMSMLVSPSVGHNELEPQIRKCLSALTGVKGCADAVAVAFLRLQPQLIWPQCCKAFLTIDDNCWPKAFPFDVFSALLKSYCSRITSAA